VILTEVAKGARLEQGGRRPTYHEEVKLRGGTIWRRPRISIRHSPAQPHELGGQPKAALFDGLFVLNPALQRVHTNLGTVVFVEGPRAPRRGDGGLSTEGPFALRPELRRGRSTIRAHGVLAGTGRDGEEALRINSANAHCPLRKELRRMRQINNAGIVRFR